MVDAWITLSPRNAALASKSTPVDRTYAIPPGLPPARFAAEPRQDVRAKLGIPSNAFVVGSVARLSRQKRPDVLIEAARIAAREVPDLLLLFVGDGELRNEAQRLADELLDGRALFAGHRNDAVTLLPALDIFCLPSDFEGVPFALLEAMAMELAVIATDVQGSGEAIRDGEDGLLVPRGQPEMIADAILRLAREPGLRRALGRAAHSRFLEVFTADKMVDATVALYEEIITRKNGRRQVLQRSHEA